MAPSGWDLSCGRSWVLWAGWERRAALVRAGGRVGERGGRVLRQHRQGAVDRYFELRVAADGPVVRGDQDLGVGVDAVVLDRPAGIVEPGRVPGDGDVGAVDQFVAVAVDADHAAPGAGADDGAEAEAADGSGHDVAVRARELVGQR